MHDDIENRSISSINDMLKKTVPTGQFDVMIDKISDCIEILVIIAHVSLDIH